MDSVRQLVVVADDFGIGLPTSQGILDLAERGRLSATVLLVNSPYAEESVRLWRRAGGANLVELGWHPCLTLDRPVLPPHRVPSLVQPDGSFHALGQLLIRVFSGRLVPAEVRAELQAQLVRFQELTGFGPRVVNGHHHAHVFDVVLRALIEVLSAQPRAYVRRVVEPLAMLRAEPRARIKRLFLTTFGSRSRPALDRAGHPGNAALVGITDPRGLAWPDAPTATRNLCRWLMAAPGGTVELMCHPGRYDEAARRCDPPSALPVRCGPEVRVAELNLLASSEMVDRVAECRYRWQSAGCRAA